jgi:hypothetical protein
MNDYTESELYSIFANVGYEIAFGSTPEEVEQDILDDYGIKIELDKELTDNYGAIIKFNNEIIHSVRGTDFFNSLDPLIDLQLMALHPVLSQVALAAGGLTGLSMSAYTLWEEARQALIERQLPDVPSPIKQLLLDSLDKIKNTLGLKPLPPATPPTPPFMSLGFGQINPAYLEWEAKYGHLVTNLQPSMSPELLAEEYRKAGQLARSAGLAANEAWWKIFTRLGYFVAIISAISVINNTLLPTTYGGRKSREETRFKRARDKYKGKKFSFTGHSLGSIANDLGRTYNIKSITFNPAPIFNNSRKPHPDSKIYRMENDFVSHFLTDNDKEDTQHIPKYPWYYNLDTDLFLKIHDINNFLPTKKRTNKIKEPLRQSQIKEPLRESHRHLVLTHKHKNENYEQILQRYSHRPIVKLLRVYSAMIEDSLEEFLPNYQRQDLSYTNKLKFKHKLKKNIYI